LIELNKFYIGESVNFMKENIPNNFVDLTVTSPPYDNLRKYNGFIFDYKSIIDELYRVTKDGGIVVWVVGDATLNGNESGSSFKQALYFKEKRFNLHDTMIYAKNAVGACGSKYSYQQSFEYMFVFTKGKIKTFNPIKDLIPKNAGKKTTYAKTKSNDKGYLLETCEKIAPESSKRQNIWWYDIGFGSGCDKTKHPAVFPEQLAQDHILSWSNENDIIFDPMCGSGTTCKMAYLNNRNFIGIDMSEEYIENICKPRLIEYGWQENVEIPTSYFS